MTREVSQIMKGVAILLMIFYHLFNRIGNVELCSNMIWIDGAPLVYILSRASHPVSFYLILGGYGMYKVYEKGDKNRWGRIGRLYVNYWMTLLIFVTLGWILHNPRYPGSLKAVLWNVTSYETTYNGEMWFLLPYAVLSLISPWLFRLYSRFRAWQIILATLFIYLCTSFCISRFGASFLYNNYWAYNPLLVFHLLFSFSLGAIAARERFFEKVVNIYRGGGNKISSHCAYCINCISRNSVYL